MKKKTYGGLLGRKLAHIAKIKNFAKAIVAILLLMIVVTSVEADKAGRELNVKAGFGIASVIGLSMFRSPGGDDGGGGADDDKDLTEGEKKLINSINGKVNKLITDYKKANDTEREALKTEIESLKKELSEINNEGLKTEVTELATKLKAMEEKGSESNDKKPFLQKVFDFVEGAKLEDRIKSKKQGVEKMEIKAAELMTIGTNITTANGYSINVNNYIDTEIGAVPKPENFILALVTVETQTGAEKIWWSERNNEEGDAAFIGEGDLKPLIDAHWETKSADIKEVAVRWKMSNRMIRHTSRVVQDFREHADELVDQKIDDQVLTGDGIGDNLSGIADVASAFVAPASLANYYTFTNIFDVINAVATQISLANFKPTVVVLNTVEKAKMLGIKDADGRYIVPPFVSPSGDVISGLQVVFSNKMPDGKILVGDLKKFKVVFAEAVMYDIGYENDDFSKNLTSNKLEAFLGTYIKAPHIPAIVYDDIATIMTAITEV